MATPRKIQSLQVADDIIVDICSIEHVIYPANTIHADSSLKTVPLIYSSLNTTEIIKSLNLTDAIIDDSDKMENVT